MSKKRDDVNDYEVLLLNNYSMHDAFEGTAPGNHLFGCAYLPSGWTFKIAPQMAHTYLRRLPFGRALSGIMWATIGDPLQTIWALRNAKQGSVVWATTQAVAPVLGMMRRAKVLPSPLVVLVHNTAHRRYTRFWLRGADSIVVFSDAIRDKLTDQGVERSKIVVAPWGPDTKWQGYSQDAADLSPIDFIATGKTYRDFTGLAEGAELGKLDGLILSGNELIEFSKGVRRVSLNRPRLSNSMVAAKMATARVVVIPVADPPRPKGLTGITELADATAMGKPVVMTHNQLLPISLEREGTGISLPRNADGHAYLSAIRSASEIPSEKVKDSLARWNEEKFRDVLLDIFRSLLSQPNRG
jgi:hypothetical protein